MMFDFAGRAFATSLIMLLAVPALAAAGEESAEMTPEQMAVMEAYMAAGTPGPQHEALAATAGEYDLLIKSWTEPGGPPIESTGTATRRMVLGGRVLVEEMESSMMGMTFTGHGMSGFDNVSGRYWSTWMDSMSTGMMMSEGTCDAEAKECVYTGSWNDPIEDGPVTVRMESRWTSPTTQLFDMYGPGPAGEEMKMMEIVYTKK